MERPKFYVALLEGGDVQSALPIVAVNDPRLVRIVLRYLERRVSAKQTQRGQRQVEVIQ